VHGCWRSARPGDPDLAVTGMTIARHSHAAWLAAGLGFALMAWALYPGLMSPDSAEQWLQARTGRYTSVHPALMAWTWSWMEQLFPGPGGLFLLHLALFWGALAWLARELFARPLPQVLLVLLVGLWPPVTVVVAHLWKDVPMLGFILLAVAALARVLRLERPGRCQPDPKSHAAAGADDGSTKPKTLAQRWPSWPRLLLALAALTLACAYRHNALPLVLPMLWFIAGRRQPALAWPQRALLGAGMAVLVAVLASLPNRLPQVEQRPVWPLTALWDLASVSIDQGQMLIPAEWRFDDLTLAELEAAFQPWTNTTIFATNKILITLYVTPTPAQSAQLRQAWLAMLREYPLSYARHRWRLTRTLLDGAGDRGPAELRFQAAWFQHPDNPPLARRQPALQQAWARLGQRLSGSAMFFAWPYLLAGAVITVIAWRQPRRHPLLPVLLASAALSVAPLPLVAPGAEFRYLVWPLVACLIAALLCWPRSHVAHISNQSLTQRPV